MKGGGGYTFSPPHGCRKTQKDRVRASLFLPIHKVGKNWRGRGVHSFFLFLRWRRNTLVWPTACSVSCVNNFLCCTIITRSTFYTIGCHYKEKKPVIIFFGKESTPSTLQMERKSVPPIAFLHLMDRWNQCSFYTRWGTYCLVQLETFASLVLQSCVKFWVQSYIMRS